VIRQSSRTRSPQVALRRIATLVAQGVQPQELFAVVAEEVGRVADVPFVFVARYEPDDTATVCGTFPPHEPVFRTGRRVSLEGVSVLRGIREHGEPARIDDYTGLEGEVADAARTSGIRSGVGVPIVVAGRVWGSIVAWGTERLPENFEARLADFTELLAAAIANAEATGALARLADEQAALRRVATLVARESSPAEIFGTVTDEACRVLESEAVGLLRFESDGTATLVAQSDTPWDPPPLGTRFPLDGENLVVRVFHTGQAARVDDWTGSSGSVAAMASVLGVRSAVASPVVVEGRLWGTIIAASSQSEPLPAEMESRLAQFTGLVATAIANAESREALAQLAEEQAALLRVATLVARGVGPEPFFQAVADEVSKLSESEIGAIVRFEDDGTVTVQGDHGGWHHPGARVELDPDYVVAAVRRTCRVARFDTDDPTAAGVPELVRSRGVRSAIAAPVIVEDKVWGAITIASSSRLFGPDRERRLRDFTDLVATAVANAQARGQVTALADEQAALRRVATLVAQGAQPDEVFLAVRDEVGRLFGTELAAVGKVEADGGALDFIRPDGTHERVELADLLASAEVLRTGRSARADASRWESADGETAERLRSLGIVSIVSSPIVVEGEVWGVVSVAGTDELLPLDAEERLEKFTEIVATAIANAESREARAVLTEEQAALRRVATLVAEGATTTMLAATVLEEVVAVLGVPAAWFLRYEPERAVSIIAVINDPWFPVGSRWPLEGTSVSAAIFETGRSARIDDFTGLEGTIAARSRESGFLSSLGVPVVVDGTVWGAICVGTTDREPLPLDTEGRLERFTELVATAISNADAREHLHGLADEQAALRRVATLVAIQASHGDVFTAIAEGISGVVGEELRLMRFEGDRAVVVAGSDGPHNAVFPVGTRLPLGGDNAVSRVFRTGEPARIDDYQQASGPIAEAVRPAGVRSAVATPIVVEGRRWGAMLVGTFGEEPVPPDTERRLSQFTELMATAIANAEARTEIERLVEQQTALRRVATLVARRVAPEEIFRAVSEEAGGLLGADFSALVRFESDDSVTVMAGPPPGPHEPGDRVPIDRGFVVYAVRETGRPARFEADDPAAGGMPDLVQRLGVRSAIVSPIVVDGELWGAVILGSLGASFPPETEQRLEEFTELVATGISNATARAELVASRARIVAAGDEARRRIERNLHDGTQQRLVSLGLAVRAAEAGLPPERDELRAQLSGVATGLVAAVEDLQEISRGIHPAILSKGGLAPALQALAHRSAIPVDLDITADVRLAEPIEVAAYFVASEALANAAKHSEGSRIDVSLEQRDGRLVLSVRDDGMGGADAARGSGLIGLTDRVEALGGSIRVSSPPGEGTQVTVELPVDLKLSQTAG
jgi:GAF domain-containing protein